MEPDLWSRSEQIFHAALQVKGAERVSFVREACGGDAALSGEVLSLLESHDEAGRWLDSPALPLPPEAEATPLEGQRMGAYRIERQLGEGGMGAVFLASRADDQYQKNVAIKLVRTGLQTPYLEERFRNERQILAALEHPHIARLLDGGITAAGQPFLVMEYIEGVAVDEWCESRASRLDDRLRLFRKICGAVHYAHQHLVIHRDLKPSNILVTADGEPKLLDFGIAKLIDTGEARVDTTAFLMATPLYASPELVNSQPVSTATDVYSLGVILYRLVTGRSPYRETAGVDLLNAILRGEIARPGGIPADLESILMKALRREPEHRYASAELLAEDVRRHLESLPVLAGSESFRYSAAKFIRRNRRTVIAGGVVAVSLVAATVVSVHQSSVAARERQLAEYRLERLRQLTGSVLFEFHDAIQTLPGATQARKLLVQRALEYLNSLDAATASAPTQRAQLVEAYRKIGDVQGNPTNANLGDTAGALASYAKALTVAQELVAASPNDVPARRALAILMQRIADTRAQTGAIREAVEGMKQALAMFDDLARRDSTLEARQQAGTSHIKLGDVLGHPAFPNLGDRKGALEHYQQALAIYGAMPLAGNAVTQRYLGIIHERIGRMLEVEGRKAEALASYEKSFAIREAFARDYPANTNARRDLAIAHEKLGDMMVASGQASRGLERFQQSLRIFESLQTLDPFNANAAHAVAVEYEKIADTASLTGDKANAKAFYAKALEVYQRLASGDPNNARAKEEVQRVAARQ